MILTKKGVLLEQMNKEKKYFVKNENNQKQFQVEYRHNKDAHRQQGHEGASI
jgi:hypothetical protein